MATIKHDDAKCAPVERDVRHLGNFSAVDPAYSRLMYCYECNVSWVGCWDNFMCPECGDGELPSNEIDFNLKLPSPNVSLSGNVPMPVSGGNMNGYVATSAFNANVTAEQK